MRKICVVVLLVLISVQLAWAVPRVMHPRKLKSPCEIGTWATRGQVVHVCLPDQKWHAIHGNFDNIYTIEDLYSMKPRHIKVMTTDNKIFLACENKKIPTPNDAVARVDIRSMHYAYLPQHKDQFLLCE